MKKILLLLGMIIAFGLVIQSCISRIVEEGGDEPPLPVNDERIYFIRLFLENFSGQSSMVLDWSTYQSVGLILEDNENNSLYANEKLDIPKESGREDVLLFDTVVSANTNGLAYAYAPYGADLTGNVLSRTLNTNQIQEVNSSGTIDDALRSNMTLVANSGPFDLDEGTCALSLRNIFSVIKLTIEESGSLLPFRNIQSAKLYIADKDNIKEAINSSPLSGNYTIDIKNSNAVPQFTSPSYSITATVAANSVASIRNKPVFYFVVNPFTLKSNETLAVRIETNIGDIIYSPFNISPVKNSFYAITATATAENTYIETTHEDYVDTYSNCYVVSKKGKYIFPADKTMDGKPLTGNRVEWLWASKENGAGSFNISELIAVPSLSYSGKYITFQVGDTDPFADMQKGNVILALKNTAGQIVWTWHIWITDEPKEIIYEGGKVFLDRNIGALSAPMVSSGINNYGFVYQWGRKDPFYGGDGNYNETEPLAFASKYTIRNTGANWTRVQTTQSSDYATQNPMAFICNPTTLNDLRVPADWLTTSDITRWSETGKTVHDPCPPGYKVPGRDALKSLHDAWLAQSTHWYFKIVSFRYWDYYYDLNEITSWPAAGMRQGRLSYPGNNGAQLLYSGTASERGYCYYWSSAPFQASGASSGGSHRIYTSGAVLYSQDDFGDNADAYPVRCMKMNNP